MLEAVSSPYTNTVATVAVESDRIGRVGSAPANVYTAEETKGTASA